jgi:hypothetical protein
MSRNPHGKGLCRQGHTSALSHIQQHHAQSSDQGDGAGAQEYLPLDLTFNVDEAAQEGAAVFLALSVRPRQGPRKAWPKMNPGFDL